MAFIQVQEVLSRYTAHEGYIYSDRTVSIRSSEVVRIIPLSDNGSGGAQSQIVLKHGDTINAKEPVAVVERKVTTAEVTERVEIEQQLNAASQPIRKMVLSSPAAA